MTFKPGKPSLASSSSSYLKAAACNSISPPTAQKSDAEPTAITASKNTLTIGAYPDASLSDAGDAAKASKKPLAAGIDPNKAKQVTRAAKLNAHANTFDAIAAEVLDQKRREGLKQDTIPAISITITRPSC